MNLQLKTELMGQNETRHIARHNLFSILKPSRTIITSWFGQDVFGWKKYVCMPVYLLSVAIVPMPMRNETWMSGVLFKF